MLPIPAPRVPASGFGVAALPSSTITSEGRFLEPSPPMPPSAPSGPACHRRSPRRAPGCRASSRTREREVVSRDVVDHHEPFDDSSTQALCGSPAPAHPGKVARRLGGTSIVTTFTLSKLRHQECHGARLRRRTAFWPLFSEVSLVPLVQTRRKEHGYVRGGSEAEPVDEPHA